MPSFSASRRREVGADLLQAQRRAADRRVAAAAIESATHLPSTARPGREGRIRTRLPSTTNRALTARCRHGVEQRLDGLRHPLRVERDAEAVDADPEADELREPLRRERADVLALERQRDRLVDERLRFGDGRFGRRRVVSVGLDVGQRGRERSRAGRVPPSRARRRRSSASTASPGCEGMIENDPPRRDDLGAAGLRERAREPLGELLGAGPRHEHRVDPEHAAGSGRPAAGRGGGTSRGRPPPARPASPRSSTVSASLGLDVVGLVVHDDVHRPVELDLGDARRREAASPSTRRRARRRPRPPRRRAQRERRRRSRPTRLTVCKVAAPAALHSFA